MPSTILITGATGFVGRQVAARLIAAGTPLNVAVRDRDQAPARANAFAIGDLARPVDWRPALAGTSCVIHLAARVHVMEESAADPLGAFRAINRDATLALARAAAEAGTRRFVYVSTIKVNGEVTSELPFRAEDRAAPVDPYAVSKWEAEQGLRALERERGIEVVVVRPPLVHGPGAGGNLARLLRLIARGRPLPFGAIRNRRTMVGVKNLADLLVLAATHAGAAGKTFLAGDRESVSTPALVRMLAETLGRPARLVPFPVTLLQLGGMLTGRRAEVERLVGSLEVDISAARQHLGWEPPVSLADGLGEMARAWREAR